MNPLPGYQHVERLSLLLVKIAMEEQLSISKADREAIKEAWSKLEDHDKSPEHHVQPMMGQHSLWPNRRFVFLEYYLILT